MRYPYNVERRVNHRVQELLLPIAQCKACNLSDEQVVMHTSLITAVIALLDAKTHNFSCSSLFRDENWVREETKA